MGPTRQLKNTIDVYTNAASSTNYLPQMTIAKFPHSVGQKCPRYHHIFVVTEYSSFLLNHTTFFSVLTKALRELARNGQDESFSCDGAIQVPVI